MVDKSGRPSHSPVLKVRGLVCIDGRYSYQGRQVNGVRPPRVALGTSDWNEAVSRALQLSQNQDARYTPGSWDFEINRFLDDRQRNKRSQWTIDADRSVLKKFTEFVGSGSRPASVTTLKVETWRDELRASGRTESTVKTYLNRLHSFFEFLSLPRNPVGAVQMPIVKITRADRFCSHEQRDLLLERCTQIQAPAATKDALLDMLMCGFHAGMRLNEMLQMRTEWIQLWEDGGEIRVQETPTFRPKGKAARRIPMNRELHRHFRKLQKAGRLDGTYVIRDDVEPGESKYRWEPRRAFHKLLEAAKLEWVGWHTLRHTYATLLVMGGCPIASVAKWLGDDIETTYNTYVGYSPIEAHVNAGLTKAKPKAKKAA
jgi:integrase